MKKLVVLLLALTVAGAVAFAQTAPKPVSTFTAWNEGIAYLYSQTGSSDAQVGWGPNWDPSNGIDQEWSFNYDGNNYGFSGTFEFGMANFAAGTNAAGPNDTTLTLGWFNTYYKFGKMVELQIGKLLISDYRAPGWLIEGQSVTRMANSEYGTLLQVKPIDGLSIGVFGNIPYDGSSYVTSTSNQAMAKDWDKNVNFGVAYAMPDTFKATLQYRTVENAAATSGKIFNAGVSITAVKPVTIVVGFQNNADSKVTDVYGSVGGSFVQSLTTNLDVNYLNLGGSVPATAAANSFGAEAQAEYAMGQYAVGVCLGYDDGNGAGSFIGNNYAIYSNGGLFLFPYVVANFDNGSYVKLGVDYSVGGAGNSNKDSLLQIPLIYVWSF